ncbi:MAG: DUF4174 domain-containing protein [Pseudomonadota bacterium]|nr:DUF4174 domain-containing protein [Pseudomonadota bacterium]
MKLSLLAPVFAAAVASQFGFAASSVSIDQHTWHDRLLVIFAADPQSVQLAAQRAAIEETGSGFKERDLALIEVIGDSVKGASENANALRQRFGVKQHSFRALLVGKDGGVKIDSPKPISASELTSTIDAMPMRRQEAGSKLP